MRHLLRPGSFLWLVSHDLRMNWRRFTGMFGNASPATALVLTVTAAIGLHALAWPALPRIAPYISGPETAPDVRLGLAGFLICVSSWMIAQGLFTATRTLYDRGDLDLLLGSPLPPHRILAAKASAICLSSLGSVAILALPVANVGALRYGPHWLALYPTLAALALASTALALIATIALFRLFGPRRARLYAQLGGAVIGGAFVLGAQVVAMLPDTARETLVAALTPSALAGTGAVTKAIWLPVDALLADRMAIVVFAAVGLAMFAAAIAALGERFARACLDAAGAPSGASTGARQRQVRFRTGPSRALRRKEWRLLVRDPSLFAQLSLQIIYTIPLAVVLVRSGSLPLALALTPAVVVIAAQVSASLAWIAISGEDAPELIASAPVQTSATDIAKLTAIAVPVTLVAALPLGILALSSPRPAMLAFLFAAGASASTALLNLWHPMPGNRRGMLRRHAQSKVIGLFEHLLAILWAIAAILALLGSWIWPVPLVLSLAVLCHGRLARLAAAMRIASPSVAAKPATASE